MLDLYLLVIGQDQEECDLFQSEVDCELHNIQNPEDRSIAAIANEHLDKCERSVFGLVHPDVVLNPGALQSFVDTALSGAVCGIVGRDMENRYRWCYKTPDPVSTLDDCSVFFRKDSGLRFDSETCDTFYAYVTDLCLQAHFRGIPVLVPPADANHVGRRFFTEKLTHKAAWLECLARVREKWAGVEFTTT